MRVSEADDSNERVDRDMSPPSRDIRPQIQRPSSNAQLGCPKNIFNSCGHYFSSNSCGIFCHSSDKILETANQKYIMTNEIGHGINRVKDDCQSRTKF